MKHYYEVDIALSESDNMIYSQRLLVISVGTVFLQPNPVINDVITTRK